MVRRLVVAIFLSNLGKDEHSASFNQVWAGYLYKLDVTITNATVSVTTKCYTRNWIKNDIQVIEAVEKK